MLVVTVYFPASPLSCILSQEPAVQNPDMFELFYYPCASRRRGDYKLIYNFMTARSFCGFNTSKGSYKDVALSKSALKYA